MTPHFELGLDSFLASVAIARWLPGQCERIGVALLFGSAEAVATMVGSLGYRSAALATVIALFAVLATSALVNRTARRQLGLAAAVLLVIPDNVLSGSDPSDALPSGIGAFLMALLGLYVSPFLLNWTRDAGRKVELIGSSLHFSRARRRIQSAAPAPCAR